MRRSSLKILAIVSALAFPLAAATPASAAPGSLDTTFSGDGKVTTPFGFTSESAAAVAQRLDRTVVAGRTSTGNGSVALAMYMGDSTLDSNFSDNGRLSNSFAAGNDYANAVAIAGTDLDTLKVFVAGAVYNGTNYDFLVAGFSDEGALDWTRIIPVGSGDDVVAAMAMQSDGKIVVAGRARIGISDDFAVARLWPNGALDSSFSGDGLLTTPFNPGAHDRGNAIVVQPDGKIVVAGESSSDFALARYTSAGLLDTSFSSDGKQGIGTGGTDVARALAFQPSGSKLVVAGESAGDFALARFLPTGVADSAFSNDGWLSTPIGSAGDVANGVAVLSNGSILAGGSAFMTNDFDFAMAKYTAAGALDPGFSRDGKQTTPIGTNQDNGNALFLQPDGKSLLAGSTVIAGNYDLALVRYGPSGSLDVGFSGDGVVTTALDSGEDLPRGIAVLPSGNVVVAGASNGDFGLAMYKPNGELDPTFSSDGRVTTPFAGFDEAMDVAAQPDGKVVAAGSSDDGFALARYLPSGMLDRSFSVDGKVTTAINTHAEAHAVALQPDGKIVAVGTAWTGAFRVAAARYTANGTLDTTFSGDGLVTTALGAGTVDLANDVAIGGDGKIVVAGESRVATGSNHNVAVIRYLANGNLDTTFSTDGFTVEDLSATGKPDQAHAVAVLSDNSILVAGNAGEHATPSFLLAKWTPAGLHDPSFSGDGIVIGPEGHASAMAIEQIGSKIVVAGGQNHHVAVARYTAAGSPDNTFSGDGVTTTPFYGSDFARAVALQADGRIVVTGSASQVGLHEIDFSVARYLAS